MNSTLGDDQRQKGDDESEGRSETMSEMSDYIPLGGSGRGPTTGTNPLSVSQMMASEDIDGAPLPPYSLTGASSERKLSSAVKDSSEGKSTSSAKRPSSVGRTGGISASSRLSGGSGGSRVGLGGTTRNLTQTPTSSASATPTVPSTAAGTTRRTSFGSSSRSMSGGAVNKPSR